MAKRRGSGSDLQPNLQTSRKSHRKFFLATVDTLFLIGALSLCCVVVLFGFSATSKGIDGVVAEGEPILLEASSLARETELHDNATTPVSTARRVDATVNHVMHHFKIQGRVLVLLGLLFVLWLAMRTLLWLLWFKEEEKKLPEVEQRRELGRAPIDVAHWSPTLIR